jgi:hypothetical protein
MTLADLAVLRLSLRATIGILDPHQDTAAPAAAGDAAAAEVRVP